MKDRDHSYEQKNLKKIKSDKFFLYKFIKKIFRIFGRKENRDFKNELLDNLEEIEGIKDLGEVERQIMINAVSFGNLTVEDIMVHRSDIIAIENKIDSIELRKIISESKHTRFPIYKDNLDNIIGFIHIKDLIQDLSEGKVDLNKILRPISSVTLNLPLPKLLVKMRGMGVHMAVVVDEYGGVDGIVAFEDVIEEIIGKVYDEHDKELEPEYIIIKSEELIKAKARLSLEDLEKLLNIKFSEEVLENIDTIGGLILSIENRVPLVNESIKYENILEFDIIEADNRSVKWTMIRKINEDKKKDNE